MLFLLNFIIIFLIFILPNKTVIHKDSRTKKHKLSIQYFMRAYQFNEKEYKKRISKFSFHPILLMTIIISIILVASIIIKPKETKKIEFYCVQVFSSESYTEAIQVANDIKNSNGAGYIIHDRRYLVLTSAYSTEKDAKSVVDNVIELYPKAQVYTRSINKPITQKDLSSDQNNLITSITNNMEKLIHKLINYSVEYDKNNIRFESMNIILKDLIKEVNDHSTNFNNLFHTNAKFNPAKTKLLDTKASLDKISHSEESTLGTMLKSETIAIIENFFSFVSYFSP